MEIPEKTEYNELIIARAKSLRNEPVDPNGARQVIIDNEAAWKVVLGDYGVNSSQQPVRHDQNESGGKKWYPTNAPGVFCIITEITHPNGTAKIIEQRLIKYGQNVTLF